MKTTPTNKIASALLASTVSQAEAAEMLGIPFSNLRAKVNRGKIPSMHIGVAIRIPRSEIEALLANHKKPKGPIEVGSVVRGTPRRAKPASAELKAKIAKKK